MRSSLVSLIVAGLLVLVAGCGSGSPFPGSYYGDLGMQLASTGGGQHGFSNVDLLVNVYDEGGGSDVEGTDLTVEISTVSACTVYGTTDGNDVLFPEQYPFCSVTDGTLVWTLDGVSGSGTISGDQLTLVLGGGYEEEGGSDTGTFTASYLGIFEPGTR